MLLTLGEDVTRPGLVDTPRRVAEAWLNSSFVGYRIDPDLLFTTFVEAGCDEMVVLRDIEFTSYCEHHLMPFSGTASIGYLPTDCRIIGVSKLARLLDCYARRLQIQERIGVQVTDKLVEKLQPSGCGCVLEAKHTCMSCRGVMKQNSIMVTSCMRGVFRLPNVKDEFFRMIGR